MRAKKQLIYCICFALLACHGNTNPYANSLNIEPSVLAEMDTVHYTTIQWKNSIYNFGKLTQDDSVHIQFNFTNVGTTPLFIFSAHSACGCTVSDYPKEPIFPGKTGFIAVTFKSGKLEGTIERTITVIANTKKSKHHILIIRGRVQPVSH